MYGVCEQGSEVVSDTFTCDECGGTFPKDWSDDEANAEAESMWGVAGASENEGMACVCDDCWQKMGFAVQVQP